MRRLRQELSFSHLLELSRASDPVARAFYEAQALAHRWSVRELKRQRDSMLFERVGLSRDREAVLALANEGRLLDTATTNVRDPYVLEFLGLPERQAYSESDLESALVDHLQEFLLELGGDFAFWDGNTASRWEDAIISLTFCSSTVAALPRGHRSQDRRLRP